MKSLHRGFNFLKSSVQKDAVLQPNRFSLAAWRAVVAGVLLVICCTGARAAAVIDQQFDPRAFLANPCCLEWASIAVDGVEEFFAQAQTFIVGVSGTLTAVDVLTYRFPTEQSPPLIVEIRHTTIDGVPLQDDGQVLVSALAPAADFLSTPDSDPETAAQFVHVGLNAGVAVVAGDKLALTLRLDRSLRGGYRWITSVIDGEDRYPNGMRFARSDFFLPVGVWTPEFPGLQNGDFGFRTFVEPTPVPVPNTLLGLLAGVLLTLRSRRRRRPPIC